MTDTAKHHTAHQDTSGGGTPRDRSQQAASTVRHWADDLATMADRAPADSPARTLVARAAEGGHRAADRLEERGVGGVREELQGFARERPAAFWSGAALAGFALGRLAKAGRAQTTQPSPSRPSEAQPSASEPAEAQPSEARPGVSQAYESEPAEPQPYEPRPSDARAVPRKEE